MAKVSWKSLPGSPYEVSDEGLVRRTVDARGSRAGRVLTAWLSNGYPMVSLRAAGVTRNVMVHTLVCAAFHGEKPGPGYYAAHRDDVRTNNNATNLYWATPTEKYGGCPT